jgi:hypothetical protein
MSKRLAEIWSFMKDNNPIFFGFGGKGRGKGKGKGNNFMIAATAAITPRDGTGQRLRGGTIGGDVWIPPPTNPPNFIGLDLDV